ncbi:serine/threonine protein kinase [Nocardioides dongxiaopingii]|uniref:serine/threonine-protein kinase n=1 Tax=Nocardioides sp. S-1144 TaxID=2582905 RepID=UPI00110D2DF3|nr:serine/threonine-protein kinase [Nocardioides sp. S-1144]QCW52130.1 serine/threonine protein kinase [Nocardioides sp. S-1144]
MSSPGPSHLGRYAVRRRIGSGGFATVWLAYDEQLDAPVAVKVLADNWSEQHEVRTRFVEEGRYLRRVESPHVVPVYDAGALDDGRPYLVMAYADQGTLADRLASGGVTVPQALEVVSQVGAGLQALHDRGILHRDVKPANVLFRTIDGQHGSGQVRAMVGDLGLGKALDVSSRLTMIAGTPAYVAPEQAQGETPDARADQFSLGVLTFLLLSGRLPWNHGSLSSAAAPTDPLPLSTPDRELPDRVEAVVRRALAHDREYRWSSVAAYVAELTAALDAWDAPGDGVRALPVDPALTQPGERPSPLSSTGPLPDPVPPRRRSRAVRGLAVAAAVLVALGAGAAAGFYAEQAGEPEPEPAAATVEDDSGQLEVTVPPGWDAQSGAPWMPPNATDTEYAALSVGTSASWTTDGEGVFLGLLPGTELPEAVPGHEQCTSAGDPQRDELGPAPPSVTVFYAGCSGDAAVIVERVVRVNDGQLLWVQLRSSDRGSAVRVLDAVRTYGL